MKEINNEKNLWVLKSVPDEDRSNKTIDSYKDKIDESYNYDSNVANSKQIKSNDLAIIIDKKNILGFAKISNVRTRTSTKIMRECPECGISSIDQRKTLKPIYRCGNGHLFDIPRETIKDVTKYSAEYKNNFIPYSKVERIPDDLLPYFTNNYNSQMSMQKLDLAALGLFPEIAPALYAKMDTIILSAEEGIDDIEPTEEEKYNNNNKDERPLVNRQIRARRGQKKFRDSLRERYGDICMVTGCTILDILEAAHISPYRGIKDNHVANGLLLRSDIHTLFDLNLLAVEPKTLIIYIHERALPEYEYIQGKKLIVKKGKSPSNEELELRWAGFNV
jgi:putative restriction endonuclease